MSPEMLEETADGSRDGADCDGAPRRGVIVVFSGRTTAFLPLGLDKPLAIGREGAVGSLLPDDRLSRHHAQITLTAKGFVIDDLGSRNGTFVDGVRVRGRIETFPRVIRAADTLLVPCDDVARARRPAVEGGCVVGRALRESLTAVARAASSSDTLLVRGETGTGKELAARRFHELGPSAAGPFVAVNCAAIPEGLAERLLFGTKRGVYSGASADAEGYLGAADGGTLFLDEAGELDVQVQAKLLRVIETREVVPLGASRGVAVSVRICMATHEDLRAAIAAGRFRRDLYHRIAPPEIVLPPVRERLDEIAQHVVEEVARGAPALSAHPKLIEACLLRPWPGNVRELRKHVRHAALAAADAGEAQVRADDLAEEAGRWPEVAPPPRAASSDAGSPDAGSTDAGPADAGSRDAAQASATRATRGYVQWAKALTREHVESVLRAHDGNVAVAARSLGMHRSQLYREMARLGLRPEDVRG
jgi:transcriptional regulator with GAF, ATPase, and Fis domain